MPKYMNIGDIPGGQNANRKYPWDEWAAIPEGKALEITEHMKGRKAQTFCAGTRSMALARGLIVRQRGERVFIFKEKQP